jgi:hypothetical protein
MPGQAQVFGLLAVQAPGGDAADPWLAGDRLDLCLDFLAGTAGLAAGEGGGQVAEFLAGLGQGGAVEPGGLGGVQLRGVGQDSPPLGAIADPLGVEGGQAAPAAARRPP